MRVVVGQYEGIDATPVLPLAAGCLVAAARMDPELATIDFAITLARRPIVAAVAELAAPDLLGLSLYPWNAAYALAVAAAARHAYPGCLIVAGGPSVPRRPERVARFFAENPSIDVLAFGEGEFTFRELVRARLREAGFEHIPGIATRAFTSAPPQRVTDFSKTASPYLDGTFDELYSRHRHRFTMALCETNRGCPFSCTFCDWSLTKKVVEFPLERVQAELDWVVDHGFSHLMFADANFGIRPRDTSIARRLVDLRVRTGLPASFYFYLTKNNHGRNLETIEILQSGGIGTWVGLAVQDFDDDVLEAVKRDNIQTGEAMKLRAICGDRGIPTFNELILGLPGQSYSSFIRTIATAMPPLPRHDFVLFLCRLIDNTELGDPASRAQYGIETRRCQWKTSDPDWDPVVDEFQEVVVATRDMPVRDWQRAYRLSYFAAALYNLRLLRVVMRQVVETAGWELASYLELLSDHMDSARAGTVYAELAAVFAAYSGSILDGGPFVLPFNGSAPPIPVDEAAARVVLRRYEEFLSETAAITPAALPEAFRYQALLTAHGELTAPVEAEFEHDWPAYLENPSARLACSSTRLRMTPVATSLDSYLACVRGRLDPVRVERLSPLLPLAPAVSPFLVLPA